MSGIGPGELMLSQTPPEVRRRLNDLRFTDAYTTNVIQPVDDVFLDQLEQLPLVAFGSSLVDVPTGTSNTATLTFPEDGFVIALFAGLGTIGAGGTPGTVALAQATVGPAAGVGITPRRWISGTVPGLGVVGLVDAVAWNFWAEPLFVRGGDVYSATVRNQSGALVTGVVANAHFRPLQP